MRFMLFVLSVTILLCGCSGSSVEESFTTAIGTARDIEPSFSLDKAIFLGDSNIAHLSSYGLIDDKNIWTGSERYLTLEPDVCRRFIVYPDTGLEMTVSDAVKIKKPDYLIITLGTDGALSLDREGFRISYISLIDSIRSASPETEIVLQSIFPIRPAEINGRFKDPIEVNRNFERSNIYISEIADEYGLVYINTHSILIDEDGMLRAEYNTDHLDGYHLNRTGLSKMLDHISQQMKGK